MSKRTKRQRSGETHAPVSAASPPKESYRISEVVDELNRVKASFWKRRENRRNNQSIKGRRKAEGRRTEMIVTESVQSPFKPTK